MTHFARGISGKALHALETLAKADEPNWFQDLLKLWKPSGQPSGRDGLRLSVRDKYLNFYRRGQSVARIGFRATGEPIVECQVKFVQDPGLPGTGYARLTNQQMIHAKAGVAVPFVPSESIAHWVRRADERADAEKSFVDAILDLDGRVIDLEMGLPAYGERKVALRMDMVGLEEYEGLPRIVFWEAKLMRDSRLRSRTYKPEVLKQIRAYENFLEDPNRRAGVLSSYREACRTLIRIGELAKALRLDDAPSFHPLVHAAADEVTPLSLDCSPRLVILDDSDGKRLQSWEPHAEVLRAAGVKFAVLSKPARLDFHPA